MNVEPFPTVLETSITPRSFSGRHISQRVPPILEGSLKRTAYVERYSSTKFLGKPGFASNDLRDAAAAWADPGLSRPTLDCVRGASVLFVPLQGVIRGACSFR